MGKRNYAICQSCGKKVEYIECSERGAPPDDACCMVLTGWLSVSHWKGMGTVDHCDFCSLTCLQRWVDSNLPKVPETFREAFGEK